MSKDTTILMLADKLTAASEVLGQLAQRDGRVREINRLRAALQAIAEGGDAVRIARDALRWDSA